MRVCLLTHPSSPPRHPLAGLSGQAPAGAVSISGVTKGGRPRRSMWNSAVSTVRGVPAATIACAASTAAVASGNAPCASSALRIRSSNEPMPVIRMRRTSPAAPPRRPAGRGSPGRRPIAHRRGRRCWIPSRSSHQDMACRLPSSTARLGEQSGTSLRRASCSLVERSGRSAGSPVGCRRLRGEPSGRSRRHVDGPGSSIFLPSHFTPPSVRASSIRGLTSPSSLLRARICPCSSART